jgi:Tfp pilus assembly protein PilO
MFIDHLNKREKKLFYIVLVFLAIVFSNNFVVTPLKKEIGLVKQEKIKKEIEWKKNNQIIKQKKQIKEEFEKYMAFIKKKGSDEEDVASFLKEIESLAQKSKVSLINIKPQPVKKMEFYKKYTIEIKGEGHIEQFVKFIYYLQKSYQILKVEKIHFNVRNSFSTRVKGSLIITKILVM